MQSLLFLCDGKVKWPDEEILMVKQVAGSHQTLSTGVLLT